MRNDLEWPVCVNVRDLGGLATTDGRTTAFKQVVRADNVHRLTAEGWAMAREYGVTSILDLRSAGERVGDPPLPPAFRGASVSLFDDFDSDPSYREDIGLRVAGRSAAEAHRTLYLEALERNRPMFGRALELVAGAEGAMLIHCVGGKDRTGVLAALLLRLADVPISVVDADYRHSERRLGVTDSAPASVIDRVLASVEQMHGTVARFFVDAGASEHAVERVRAKLRGG